MVRFSNTNIALDYYPFGMLMPGRSYSSTAYKYGFNGKEKDDEVKGAGNSLDFGARLYDSRLGKWLSLDPLQNKYPSLSPYMFSGNSPISFKDYDGKDFGFDIDISSHAIIITQNYYAISEATRAEAQAAANNYNSLVSNTTIAGEVYTVKFEIKVKLAEGENFGQMFENAHLNSNADRIGNTYNGYICGFPLEKDFGKKVYGPMSPEAGFSDGKNITMPMRQGSDFRSLPEYRGTDPNAVGHEMGHNLGESDPGGVYYSPGGAMDYNGPYPPTDCDIENIVKYSLDAQNKGEQLNNTGTHIAPGSSVGVYISIHGSIKEKEKNPQEFERKISNLKSENVGK